MSNELYSVCIAVGIQTWDTRGMAESNVTTIRLNDEDRKAAAEGMEKFGFKQLSPFIRFALRRVNSTDEKIR